MHLKKVKKKTAIEKSAQSAREEFAPNLKATKTKEMPQEVFAAFHSATHIFLNKYLQKTGDIFCLRLFLCFCF